MIKKIITFIKSDGWLNTVRFIKNVLMGATGNDQSSTLLYYRIREDLRVSEREAWKQYRSVTYTRPEEIHRLDFPRLKYHPYQKWLSEGAICRVLFKEDKAAAFSWTHFDQHCIDKVGTLEMGGQIAWLGPYFVHKDYRGQSLQQLMLMQDITYAPECIHVFITSVSSKNTASSHSMSKMGFQQGGICRCVKGEIKMYIDPKATNYLKIKR